MVCIGFGIMQYYIWKYLKDLSIKAKVSLFIYPLACILVWGPLIAYRSIELFDHHFSAKIFSFAGLLTVNCYGALNCIIFLLLKGWK